MMDHRDVERFSGSTRSLHWIVMLSALILAVTGMVLYVPQWGFIAQDGYTRVIHRVAAVFFVGVPLIYFITHPLKTLRFVLEAFTWWRDDWKWLKAAPDYYFGGDESKMPPQGHMNSGQKLFWTIALLSSLGFIGTGFIMWFLSEQVTGWGFHWSLFIHDVCLIVGGTMIIVHFYLGVVHPRMTESLRSMITGKASTEYVKGHHGKWYRETSLKPRKMNEVDNT
ncbi:MAG: cytochrome b/b6 domain-containing protein [Chloroflexota bacterium]|nr:cytochrome b/b6 domain-containing protein [Chloroflexota bacterium]